MLTSQPRPTGKVRVAALLRVSTVRQARKHRDDEETLPVQREAIRRFVAARSGWSLVEEYAEEGVSAWSNRSEDRRILQTVLADARRGGFDVLAIFKYDRLSRVSLEYPMLLSHLDRLGVAVWSVADDGSGRELRIQTQMDKLLRFVEGWQAEMESCNTSVRVSAKMRQMAQQGIWTGGRPPYGFRLRDGGRLKNGGQLSLEVDEGEAAVVREVFRMYLEEELGSTTIARRLNAMGYRLRNGREWQDTSVRDLIKNPTVAGRAPYGRHYRDKSTGAWRHRPQGDPEVIIAPRTVPEWEIVPWETWLRAQKRMSSWMPGRRDGLVADRGRTRSESGSLLLTGLLRCGHCGGALTAGSSQPVKRLKDGTLARYRYPRYVDRNRHGGRHCEGQAGYSVKRVDAAVLAAVRTVLDAMGSNAIYQAVRQAVAQGAFQHSAQLELARKRRQRAQRLLDAWTGRLDAWLIRPDESLYTEAFIAERLREAQAEAERAGEELARLEREHGDADARLAQLDRFLALAPAFWQRFLGAQRREQKRLLRQMLRCVEVSREGIVLHWRVDLGEIMGDGDLGPLEWEAWTRLVR